jgi:peroxiredoxin
VLLPRFYPPFFFGALALWLSAGSLWAGSAEQDWADVVALDAGPATQPRTAQEARTLALEQLDRQERTLRLFLKGHPEDAHAFEGRLRLSRLLQIRGDVQGNTKAVEESRQILEQLATLAKPEQRVEVAFARVTFLMRTMGKPTPEKRDRLMEAARRFQREYPDDRRIPPVLVELAKLYELQPKTMKTLLTEALGGTRDAELKTRIFDDLKRVDSLGQPVALSGSTVEGANFEIGSLKGHPVVLVFFARWSIPSMESIETIKRDLAQLPTDAVRMVGVSLDSPPEAVSQWKTQQARAWTILCDGRGWESPVVRGLGINALPTVWLLDKQGRLRSLNGLESFLTQIRQLIHSH